MDFPGFIILMGGALFITSPLWVVWINKKKKNLGYFLVLFIFIYFVIGYIYEKVY
jgi:hypothetical protein